MTSQQETAAAIAGGLTAGEKQCLSFQDLNQLSTSMFTQLFEKGLVYKTMSNGKLSYHRTDLGNRVLAALEAPQADVPLRPCINCAKLTDSRWYESPLCPECKAKAQPPQAKPDVISAREFVEQGYKTLIDEGKCEIRLWPKFDKRVIDLKHQFGAWYQVYFEGEEGIFNPSNENTAFHNSKSLHVTWLPAAAPLQAESGGVEVDTEYEQFVDNLKKSVEDATHSVIFAKDFFEGDYAAKQAKGLCIVWRSKDKVEQIITMRRSKIDGWPIEVIRPTDGHIFESSTIDECVYVVEWLQPIPPSNRQAELADLRKQLEAAQAENVRLQRERDAYKADNATLEKEADKAAARVNFMKHNAEMHREQYRQEHDNALMLYKALIRNTPPEVYKPVVEGLFQSTNEYDKLMSEASRWKEKHQRATWKIEELESALVEARKDGVK